MHGHAVAEQFTGLSADPQQRRPSTRDRILAAARAGLNRDGLDGLCMAAIAAEAGVARRTIYNQFTGRQALFRASRTALAAEFSACLARRMPAATGGGIVGLASILADCLSEPAHADLHRSLHRDRSESGWLEPLYARQVTGPLVQLVVRWLALNGRPVAAPAVQEALALTAAICAAAAGSCNADAARQLARAGTAALLAQVAGDASVAGSAVAH